GVLGEGQVGGRGEPRVVEHARVGGDAKLGGLLGQLGRASAQLGRRVTLRQTQKIVRQRHLHGGAERVAVEQDRKRQRDVHERGSGRKRPRPGGRRRHEVADGAGRDLREPLVTRRSAQARVVRGQRPVHGRACRRGLFRARAHVEAGGGRATRHLVGGQGGLGLCPCASSQKKEEGPPGPVFTAPPRVGP